MMLKAHRGRAFCTKKTSNCATCCSLRPRLTVDTVAAEVMYETPDQLHTPRGAGQRTGCRIEAGSPVMDDLGVLGQVTRVQPFSSEVTLLSDRDQAIPVMVARTGVRSVAYWRCLQFAHRQHGAALHAHDADIAGGGRLVTSGVDGVYLAGLPVARVVQVERRAQSPFMRIYCEPVARLDGARHVMVLTPLNMVKAQHSPDAAPIAPSEAETKRQREDKSAQRRALGKANLPGAGGQR